ncbi:MAG: formyl transferase [Chitinophagaceae bacterium]|nr:formyl transferase [Chitinophagaceae bacterium]
MKNKKILLLGGNGLSTNVLFNAINKQYGVSLVIIEEKEPLKVFLKRRIKRLGVSTVIGQILFSLLIASPLAYLSKGRVKEILGNADLNGEEIPSEKIIKVRSVNSSEALNLISKINPDLIIVSGTRIISKKILECVQCKFINIHAGITPKYRGVHGTYWALINNDIENSGVTIHFLDDGIDTGNIIEQRRISPTTRDNFVTYPFLQLSCGIELLYNAIENYFSDRIKPQEGGGESNLYYHPTITQYLYYRYIKGIK